MKKLTDTTIIWMLILLICAIAIWLTHFGLIWKIITCLLIFSMIWLLYKMDGVKDEWDDEELFTDYGDDYLPEERVDIDDVSPAQMPIICTAKDDVDDIDWEGGITLF